MQPIGCRQINWEMYSFKLNLLPTLKLREVFDLRLVKTLDRNLWYNKLQFILLKKIV